MERTAIAAGDNLRGLGGVRRPVDVCLARTEAERRQSPASILGRNTENGFLPKIRNLTEDCIACRFVKEPTMWEYRISCY